MQNSTRSEFTLAQEEKLTVEKKQKLNKEWIWWTLVGAFIVGTIGAMFAADYFYAPGVNNPSTLAEAVGK
jgi:hypothetical protein